MSATLLSTTAFADKKDDKKQAGNAAAGSGLNPKTFQPFRLKNVQPYNHNTKLFIFELAAPNAKLGLQTSSFILAKATVNDKEEVRPYTPINQHVPGEIHLLIKKYETGKVSKHVHALKVGDSLEMKGPMPKLKYEPNMKRRIGMIAGGTGITPMLQVINEILSNPSDNTEVSLLFANIAPEDILLKERLDARAAKHRNFKVHYVLERPPPDWKGSRGYVSADTIKRVMPPPGNDTLIYVCGPPPMMTAISGNKTPDYQQGELTGLLKDTGYTAAQVYKF